MTALIVLAILVLLIVIHELGHFAAAKFFKVRVEEFGVGYPPRAFSFGKWGGTEYTLNWIPFGGFVRLWGDEGEGQHGKGSLVDANRGVQAIILVAGVAANAVLGWVLFTVALHMGIPRVVTDVAPEENVRLIVAEVVAGSPAAAAGLQAGDEILGLSDELGSSLTKLNPTLFAEFTSERAGRSIELEYKRGDVFDTVTIIPAHAVIPDRAGQPAVGVAIASVVERQLPWGEAAVEALRSTKNAILSVAQGLWSIAERALHGESALAGIVGPIGLVQVVGSAADTGIASVLALAGFISVNLAVINLIPIPALDGGRLLLLGFETVLRRGAPRLAVQLLNAIGVGLIVLLMIVVTYNDILRLLA